VESWAARSCQLSLGVGEETEEYAVTVRIRQSGPQPQRRSRFHGDMTDLRRAIRRLIGSVFLTETAVSLVCIGRDWCLLENLS
jgi:hypothetical protein